jgi:ABC-type phosphate transport system substrate-binding protein
VNTSRLRSALVVPVLVLAAAGLTSCGGDDAATDSAAEATTSPSDSGATSADTLALTADGSSAGKCAVPSAEVLATFDTAFAGTVTSLQDGTATLSVDQWYAGGEASTVTVEAPSKDLADLLMAVDFEQGKSYLVSATDDRVTLCGFTAEQNPELQAMYEEAFAG